MAEYVPPGARREMAEAPSVIERRVREVQIGEHVVIADEVGSGRPIFLLVHGIGMGKDAYVEFVDALGKRGICVAIDLPGFGDAPRPRQSLSIVQLGQLLAEFLERGALGQVVAIGHSMGTQVVAELAVQRPDLIESLVLIAPTVNAAERTTLWQVRRMLQDLWGAADARVIGRGLWLYARTGPTWFVRKFRAMMTHHVERIAPEITVPTLVLRGENDRVCPEDWSRSVAEMIPGATYREVPGRSHEAMISSAEPVADLIVDFARK